MNDQRILSKQILNHYISMYPSHSPLLASYSPLFASIRLCTPLHYLTRLNLWYSHSVNLYQYISTYSIYLIFADLIVTPLQLLRNGKSCTVDGITFKLSDCKYAAPQECGMLVHCTACNKFIKCTKKYNPYKYFSEHINSNKKELQNLWKSWLNFWPTKNFE